MKIENDRYKELVKKERKLQALESGGVDNWEWYDESLKEYREYIEKEEKLEEVVHDILEALSELITEPAGRGAGYGFHEEAWDEVENILREEFLTNK